VIASRPASERARGRSAHVPPIIVVSSEREGGGEKTKEEQLGGSRRSPTHRQRPPTPPSSRRKLNLTAAASPSIQHANNRIPTASPAARSKASTRRTGQGSTYDEGGDGGDGEREVAAEVGVGEEGADDGGEAGGAVEPVEEGGGVHAPHVEHLRQVHQQVRRRAQRPQLLERLVACRPPEFDRSHHQSSVATPLPHARDAARARERERERTDDEGHGLPAVVLDGGPRALLPGAPAVLRLVHVHALELPRRLLVLPPAGAHSRVLAACSPPAASSSRGRRARSLVAGARFWSLAPVSNERSIMPTGL
jgi:hypothetical protein